MFRCNTKNGSSMSLFEVQDDIGRTILHCWIGRWQQRQQQQQLPTATSDDDSDDLQLFRTIIQANPQQLLIHDGDGYTPLLQLLQTTVTTIPEVVTTTTKNNNSDDVAHDTTTIMEQTIYEMIQTMVQYHPHVVTISKQQHRHSCTTNSNTLQQQQSNHHQQPLLYALLYGRSVETIQLLVTTYPRKHHRHHHQHDLHSGSRACTNASCSNSSVILQQYQREVAIHIAITTMAPLSIVQCIVHDCPHSTVVRDRFHLSSIDWVWLVYVREYHYYHLQSMVLHQQQQQQQQQQPAQLRLRLRQRQSISRRRHLPKRIIEWHNSISSKQQQTLDTAVSLFPNNTVTASNESSSISALLSSNIYDLNCINNDFYERLKILLPAAASTLWHKRQQQQQKEPSVDLSTTPLTAGVPFDMVSGTDNRLLLHAACFVPCPVTVIQFILLQQLRGCCVDKNEMDPYHNHQSIDWKKNRCHPSLQYRDACEWRYPLHYAATRVSYQKTRLPIGVPIPICLVSSSLKTVLRETFRSPVQAVAQLYPYACMERDIYGQLPLHIVIDTYKQYRSLRRRRHERHNQQQSVSKYVNEVTDEENNDVCDDELLLEYEYYNNEENSIIQLLLDIYPNSINIRDGRTMLYPYQQAAAATAEICCCCCHTGTTTTAANRTMTKTMNPNGGSSCCMITNYEKEKNNDDCDDTVCSCRLTTIYQLLRFDPTVI